MAGRNERNAIVQNCLVTFLCSSRVILLSRRTVFEFIAVPSTDISTQSAVFIAAPNKGSRGLFVAVCNDDNTYSVCFAFVRRTFC